MNMIEIKHRSNIQSLASLLLIASAGFVLCGCQRKGPNFSFAPPTGNGAAVLWQEPGGAGDANDRTLWYAQYVGDSKIGHRRLVVHKVKIGTETLNRIASDDHLETLRFSKRNEQDLTQASIERNDGQIHAFGYRIESGDTTSTVAGTVSGSQVEVVRSEGEGKEEKGTMGWPKDGPSIFAVEQSLWQKPMVLDEERTVRVYRPLEGAMTTLRLTAVGVEPVDVAGETRDLLRIESKHASSDDLASVSTHWTDNTGLIVKTVHPFMDRTTVLVTEDQAMSPNQPYNVDVGFGNVIKTMANFESDPAPTTATYKVTLKSLPPKSLFANGLSQQMRASDGSTAFVRVRPVTPDRPLELKQEQDKPTTEDRTPNPLIDCDDRRVKAFAEAVTSRDRDPWKTAVAFESAVFSQLDKSETSQVFDSAGLVLDKRSGDCSEHAVLLAAACRNYGIPARVVVGLIYDKPRGGFLYHMWNEVWIRDRWIPLDATIGQGKVGVDHIKFHDSSLAGQSPYSIVTPIVNVMGQLEIELLGFKYD